MIFGYSFKDIENYETRIKELNRSLESATASKTQAENNYKDLVRTKKIEIEDLTRTKDIEIARIKTENEISNRKKELEISYNKDKEIKAATDKSTEFEKKLAVATREVEMYKEIIDMSGELVDVKELINKLIAKLPSIDLKNITVNTTSTATDTKLGK